MGCRCSSLCETTLPLSDKPLGHLSVTTPHGQLIPVRFFNVKHRYTVLMSGASISQLTTDVRGFARQFSRVLDCNLMAFWTETPKKGSLMDFESVLKFVQSCTRHSMQEIVVYSNDEEASDALRLGSKYPDIAGLVLSLARSGLDVLRSVLRVMEKLDQIESPICLLHSLAEPPTALLSKSAFSRGGAKRRVKQISKKVAPEDMEGEVLKHLVLFFQMLREPRPLNN